MGVSGKRPWMLSCGKGLAWSLRAELDLEPGSSPPSLGAVPLPICGVLGAGYYMHHLPSSHSSLKVKTVTVPFIFRAGDVAFM